MALPMSPNVTVDVYRGSNPGSPYALGLQVYAGVGGSLQPRVVTGRHGTANWLKWTHILYLTPDYDIRDAYNSQLDPSRNNAAADTVIVSSTTGLASQTAFYVVYVELAAQGAGAAHLRVYLDRFQPSSWPTDAL